MTGYERRIRDWSSDVCSSDLIEAVGEDDEFLHRIFTALPPPVHEFRSGLDRLFAVRSRPLPPTDPVGSVFEKLGGAEGVGKRDRSEERRVGKVCVSTCSSRWSPYL